MKKSKIIVGIFDGQTNNIRYELVDNDLFTWYKLINCDCIDITQFAGYDCICDDEALLHGEPKPTILRYDNYDNLVSAIYGTVVICRSYNEELDTLTDDDIKWLGENIMILEVNSDEYEGYAMVDRLRYDDLEIDYDLVQVENTIYLNDEDIY
jgi:hypothetical protein